KPKSQGSRDKSNETSPAAMQKLMARKDDADRGKQAKLLLVGKISGVTDGRCRCRQDKDPAEGKRQGVAKMHAWKRILRSYRKSIWHNDNDRGQHLKDKPTEGKVRIISPRYACGREHKVGDQAHHRHGAEKPVVYSRRIPEGERQCHHDRDRPDQDVFDPLPSVICRHKREDHQNIENCQYRDNCQQGPARKALTGDVRFLLTANELWHFGATLRLGNCTLVGKYTLVGKHRVGCSHG